MELKLIGIVAVGIIIVFGVLYIIDIITYKDKSDYVPYYGEEEE